MLSYANREYSVNYTCDVDGIRTSKHAITPVGTIDSKYIYDGNNLVAEQRNGGWIYYIYGVDGISGFRYNGITYLYRKNVQGDVTHIYRQEEANTLTQVAHYSYDAWGNIRILQDKDGIATLNSFRYRSYYFDEETGLYYLQSRYYDPELGRFISADSIEYLDPETLGGLNLYAYCGNNPVMGIDPEGTEKRKWWEKLLIGLTIVVVAIAFAAVVIASAGAVAAVAGTAAAAIGLSAAAVSTVATVASIATVAVGVGIAAFGVSDAIEVWSDGVNPIRDWVMGGNQTLYDNTKLGFNIAGSVATLVGSVAPSIIRGLHPQVNFGGHNTPMKGQPPCSQLITDRGNGYQINFYDAKGNGSLRWDIYTQPGHSNPHLHYDIPGSKGSMIGIWWWIKKLLGK